MHAFSTLSAVIAFALSVNPATISKRAVDPNVQTCINDMNAAGAQLLTVTAVSMLSPSSAGYSGALNIHNHQTGCCATTATVSEEDAQAFITVLFSLVPNITTAINAIIGKKAQFATISLATTIVKTDIASLNKLLNTLDSCLLAVTPADDLVVAQGYVDTVNADFTNADAAYDITA